MNYEEYEDPIEEENECYYGFGCCIDFDCRDRESCLGCELLYPSKKEEVKP